MTVTPTKVVFFNLVVIPLLIWYPTIQSYPWINFCNCCTSTSPSSKLAWKLETLPFSNWKHSHYFYLVRTKDDKSIIVKCRLCAGRGTKTLFTTKHTTSNLLKHLLWSPLRPWRMAPALHFSSTDDLRLSDIVYGYLRFYSKWDQNLKMILMLYWRRLETGDWDHKCFRKLFSEVINQVRKGVFFFSKTAYNQTFCNQWSHPLLAMRKNAALRHFTLASFFRPRSSVHLLYCLCLYPLKSRSFDPPWNFCDQVESHWFHWHCFPNCFSKCIDLMHMLCT